MTIITISGECGSHISTFVRGSYHSNGYHLDNLFCDTENEKSGDYWLATNRFTGEAFVADLGTSVSVGGIILRNTKSAGFATKKFRVSIASQVDGTWEELMTVELYNPIIQLGSSLLQQFNTKETKSGRFIKFELLEYYGSGGGLNYFDVIEK